MNVKMKCKSNGMNGNMKYIRVMKWDECLVSNRMSVQVKCKSNEMKWMFIWNVRAMKWMFRWSVGVMEWMFSWNVRVMEWKNVKMKRKSNEMNV